MIEKSVAFSKQLVTRTTGVSAISYMILGDGHFLIISHWWIVLIACQMTNCVIVLFLEARTRETV